MKLSTKGRYAITALIELALHHKQGPVTLADISVEQSISVSYLEQLFAQLRKHGLVTGLRGPGGGYCLRRPPSEISVAEILRAVDESIASAAHTPAAEDSSGERPPSLRLWDKLSHRIYDYLDSISLADVVSDGQRLPAGQNRRPGFALGGQRSAA
ncbi:Rrf2 family transcriptional regulator [Thiohalobacter sp. IOR34]|uniref:Rrf2 family transcriptional regulator n=1 Tax=Thiohalobacter sp. IOR34 TaxID=3057176 RepID=UPI0025B05FCC|nr:Rrf2 family transcriptional regulator [Thiohalobacter sp. IOR34]WJW76020.1 Rrf2 family transcriptional regulator [Thiohalobacter sp. IOR34]